MGARNKLLAATLLLCGTVILLPGCGCGFDCNNGNNNNSDEPVLLTLGLSDALPEELKQVVIEVDRITFSRDDDEDVVVDTFSLTLDGDDLVDVESFQVDLLDYQGANQLVVIDDLEMDADFYNGIILDLIVDGVNSSYVQEADDSLVELTVTEGQLTLPGREFLSGEQVFTIEFGLAQSLRYQDNAENYRLTTDGIRLVNNATASRLTGRVDDDLFDSVAPCDEKDDPESGNRVYLYQGHGLEDDQLADVYNDDNSNTVPDDTVAPFAVASLAYNQLTGSWEYAFGFLPADNYSIGFSCDTADDDSVDFDDLDIPLPEGQVYEVSIGQSESVLCDLGPDTDC